MGLFKGLLRKCIRNRRIDQEKWCKGLLSLRNTPHKTTGLSPAVLVYGHPVNEVVPAHKSALQKSWHKRHAEYDTMIARERQRAERYQPGKSLPPPKVGTPVLIQNRVSKRWDKYGIVQERNVGVRKYLIRLPSGFTTVRNRQDIRQ